MGSGAGLAGWSGAVYRGCHAWCGSRTVGSSGVHSEMSLRMQTPTPEPDRIQEKLGVGHWAAMVNEWRPGQVCEGMSRCKALVPACASRYDSLGNLTPRTWKSGLVHG